MRISAEEFGQRQRDIQRQRRRSIIGSIILDGVAALASFWFLIATASAFGGGLGWAGLAPVLPPFILAFVYAYRRRIDLRWAIGLAFPCVVVIWPLMYVVVLLIAGPPTE